uniref:Uncharacterized protein n=1 Tax=Ditylenchus dipsaci TaxID=166011 RepID=A0A915E9J1_9BILA
MIGGAIYEKTLGKYLMRVGRLMASLRMIAGSKLKASSLFIGFRNVLRKDAEGNIQEPALVEPMPQLDDNLLPHNDVDRLPHNEVAPLPLNQNIGFIEDGNVFRRFKLEFPFRPYDSFFAIKVVEWTEDIKQNYGVISSIVEHKSKCLKQSFVQSTTAKPFRLLLNCYNGHKTRDRRFLQTNPRTKELLELREVSKDERNLIVSGGMYEKYFCSLERKPI